MYFRDLLTSLLRRWYVAVLGIGLTVYLCTQIVDRVQVTYDSDGSVLLLPPKSSVGDEGNPYLYLGGLSQAVDVLVARLQSDEVLKGLADAHPDTTITAVPDTTTTGPIIKVTATGPDADASLAATRAMMDALPTELAGLQTELSVPDPSRITSMDVTASEEATPDTSGRDRLVLAAGAVGVVLSILLAGLIDGLIVSRRNRRAARREQAALAAGAAPGPDADAPEPEPAADAVQTGTDVEEEALPTVPVATAAVDVEPSVEPDVEPEPDQPHDEGSDQSTDESADPSADTADTADTADESTDGDGDHNDDHNDESGDSEGGDDSDDSEHHPGSDEHQVHEQDQDHDQRPEHASSW